jgi:hypothetical protein
MKVRRNWGSEHLDIAIATLPCAVFKGWKHPEHLETLPCAVFKGWKHPEHLETLPCAVFKGWTYSP